MVVYTRRMSQKKRGTRRRRSGVLVVVTRRPRRTRPARVFRRGGGERPRVVSSASACAFLVRRAGTTRQTQVYPISCRRMPVLTREAVTAPTGLGAAYYIFLLDRISGSMYVD